MLGLVYLGEMRCPSCSTRAVVVELKQRSHARDLSLCRCALSHGGKGAGAPFCPSQMRPCSKSFPFSSCLEQDPGVSRLFAGGWSTLGDLTCSPCSGADTTITEHRPSSLNPPQRTHEPQFAFQSVNCSFVLQALLNTVLFHVTVLFMEE